MQDIYFPEEYFIGEEVEGFYVDEKMKRAHAAFAKVLCVFDDFCQNNNLTYFIGYGTLLGAVRHKGFIPWDDDIDLMMPRSDYYRMLDLAKENKIPKGFHVDSIRLGNMDLAEPLCAFTNYEDTWNPYDLMEDFYGCPYIIGLDIYVQSPIPSDPELQGAQQQLYNLVYDAAFNYENYVEAGVINDMLSPIESFTKTKIDYSGDIRMQLWDLSVKILELFPEKECHCLMTGNDYTYLSYGRFYKKSWFEKNTYLPFSGGIKVSAPLEYEAVLAHTYGDSYMTPRQFTAGHNYPFYKRQDIFLKENFGIEF